MGRIRIGRPISRSRGGKRVVRRSHRSAAINLKRIRSLNRNFKMKNGFSLVELVAKRTRKSIGVTPRKTAQFLALLREAERNYNIIEEISKRETGMPISEFEISVANLAVIGASKRMPKEKLIETFHLMKRGKENIQTRCLLKEIVRLRKELIKEVHFKKNAFPDSIIHVDSSKEGMRTFIES